MEPGTKMTPEQQLVAVEQSLGGLLERMDKLNTTVSRARLEIAQQQNELRESLTDVLATIRALKAP